MWYDGEGGGGYSLAQVSKCVIRGEGGGDSLAQISKCGIRGGGGGVFPGPKYRSVA